MKHKNIKGKIYVSKSDDFTIRCIFLDLRSPHPFPFIVYATFLPYLPRDLNILVMHFFFCSMFG